MDEDTRELMAVSGFNTPIGDVVQSMIEKNCRYATVLSLSTEAGEEPEVLGYFYLTTPTDAALAERELGGDTIQ